MSTEDIVTADELKSSGRKKVRLTSGKHVMIGRLSLAKFVEIAGHLPDVSKLKRDKEKIVEQVMSSGKAGQMTRIVEDVVLAGVIQPRLFADPEEGPTPRDFNRTDRMALFTEIMKLSSVSEEAGGEVLPLPRTSA